MARAAAAPLEQLTKPEQRVKLLTRVAAFYHQTLLNVPEGIRD